MKAEKRLIVDFEQEFDGRWIADVMEIDRVSIAYGKTKLEALQRALESCGDADES